MRCSRIIVPFVLSLVAMMLSCKKYEDKKATADPRLTTHYCNDPDAVNYNWGFPGIPDNTVCFYPTDIFKGVYELHDSISFKQTGYFISADTVELTIVKSSNSNTKFTVSGFCSSGALLSFTAGVNFYATLDTTIGDTTTRVRGQALCSNSDTVYGTLFKDRLNDSILYINFEVASDTGVTTVHLGSARLKHK